MKNVLEGFLAITMALSLVACGSTTSQTSSPEIKNVILMISDGTSIGVPTLSRWYKSYDETSGLFDTDIRLNVDNYTSGLIRTYWQSTDGNVGAITDSAPGATAYATGYKTNDKFVGVGPDEKPHATVLELAESQGKSTGLVTTVNLQHATPAAFSAHTTDRSDYEDIAAQMLESGADVLLGGGSQYMQNRLDGRDLIAELKQQGYGYVTTADELAAFKGKQVYGMFAPDFMAYDVDRAQFAPSQPSLSTMTDKAISLLTQNDKGFFLMVEGSKVDWGAHNNDPSSVVSEYLAFDDAVKTAIDFAKSRTDTMVLVVEDHSTGGISIGSTVGQKKFSSYPLKDIIAPLTKAKITSNGAIELLAQGKDIKEVLELMGITNPTKKELKQLESIESQVGLPGSALHVILGQILSKRCNIGWTTTGHTGEDVVFYSYLPGNERLTGLYENTEISNIVCDAWGAELTDAVCPHQKK